VAHFYRATVCRVQSFHCKSSARPSVRRPSHHLLPIQRQHPILPHQPRIPAISPILHPLRFVHQLLEQHHIYLRVLNNRQHGIRHHLSTSHHLLPVQWQHPIFPHQPRISSIRPFLHPLCFVHQLQDQHTAGAPARDRT